MIGVLASVHGSNLQALLDAGLPVVAVASNKPEARALGRARAVGVAAASFPLEDYPDRAARDAAMAGWLTGCGVDLVVLAGFMHLLTPAFLERFPERIVNVHPSLLPAFPGAHAVEEQLAAGVPESGATVHVVDEGIDSGPIVLQEPVPVREDDTVASLHARIQAVEHRLLPQATRIFLAQVVVG